MTDLKQFLADWIINYFKNRDIMLDNIVSIDKNKDNFDAIINEQDKKIFCLALDEPKNLNFELDKKEIYAFVMLNKRKSLDFLIDNWEKLSEFTNLRIFLINPLSSLDKKWIISPNVHNKICDPKTLKAGLKSMFEAVEPILDKDLNKLN